MSDGRKVVGNFAERSGKLAKVDGEVLILGQDVREETLATELALGYPEGDPLVPSVDRVADLDGVSRKVLRKSPLIFHVNEGQSYMSTDHKASDDVPDTEGHAVTVKFAVDGGFGRSSVAVGERLLSELHRRAVHGPTAPQDVRVLL